jgi:hypothetical protein
MPSSYSNDVGAKSVVIKTSDDEKMQLTVIKTDLGHCT